MRVLWEFCGNIEGVLGGYCGSYVGMLRELCENTVGVRWNYCGSTVGILCEYCGNTMGILQEYRGSTVGILREFFRDTVGIHCTERKREIDLQYLFLHSHSSTSFKRLYFLARQAFCGRIESPRLLSHFFLTSPPVKKHLPFTDIYSLFLTHPREEALV